MVCSLYYLDPPVIDAVLVPKNTTTIEFASINPKIGWDYFSITSASTQSFNQLLNEPSKSLPLDISGLNPGSRYMFNIYVTISNDCDFGTNQPSSVTVITCTGLKFMDLQIFFVESWVEIESTNTVILETRKFVAATQISQLRLLWAMLENICFRKSSIWSELDIGKPYTRPVLNFKKSCGKDKKSYCLSIFRSKQKTHTQEIFQVVFFDLKFAVYNGLVFHKWSLFLVQRVLIKYLWFLNIRPFL